MSKIKLTGSNSGYVEIDSAADAGNLTLTLPTSGVRLLSNTDNVFSGITTTAELDINGKIDVSTDIVGGRNLKVTGITTLSDDVTFTGASYNVLWDKSDNQLEFADNAKISLGSGGDMQLYHDGNHTHLHDSGSGVIYLRTNMLQVNNAANNQTFADFSSSAANLYSGNSRKFQTTNTGAIVTGICTATSFSGSGENLTRTTQLSHRNVIINGDMRVAQRATSHGSSGYRTIDRFKMTAGGANTNLTQAQVDVASGTSPYVRGFRKAFSITNAGQNANNQGYVYMLYEIEAQDIATSGWRYMYNSGGDDYITLSFWVKASVAQNYLFFIHTSDGTVKEWSHLRSLSANAWTKVELSIPGDSGITINNDTGVGLNLYFVPYLGDHYTSGSNVDQWVNHAGYTSRPDMPSTWWTTSNATFQLTGVQLEVGEQATPFEHRSYGEQLSRCERYFQCMKGPSSTTTGSNEATYGIALAYNNNRTLWSFNFKTEMRTNPTVSMSNLAHLQGLGVVGGWNAASSFVSANNFSKFGGRVDLNWSGTPYSVGHAVEMRITSDGLLGFDAEL